MLKSLKEKNVAILVSTPYMDEASLCDRIALIQNGEILSIDQPQRMVEKFDKPLYAIKAENTYQALKDLRTQPFTESALPFGEYIHLITTDFHEAPEIKALLEQEGIKVEEVKPMKATVEDIFLDLSEAEETITT